MAGMTREGRAQAGNALTGSPVDRAGDRRKDAAFVERARRDPAARLLPMHGGRHLVTRDGEALRAAMPRASASPALALALEENPWVLLGLIDGTPAIALDLGDGAENPPEILPGTEFVDLRAAAPLLPEGEASLLAHARGFLHWRRTHRFCGVCGGTCEAAEGGAVVRCTACGRTHFPRTDPAVIMLVTRGETALLARNARFGERRMFSTLAGFVEPGESLEEAVAREVAEECGVRVGAIRYHSSQPWPFPASVMLGFVADTEDSTITIDGDEIVEAAFFTRDEIRRRDALGFGLPPRTSIARRLIEDWLEGE